jgi:pantoate--beta-alanine ligase
VREADGLAMSSRNKYLNPDQRQQAIALWQAIQFAKKSVREQKTLRASLLKASLKRQIGAHPEARLDYIEFFDPATFRPVTQVKRGTHVALAVFVGKTRLIDNARL